MNSSPFIPSDKKRVISNNTLSGRTDAVHTPTLASVQTHMRSLNAAQEKLYKRLVIVPINVYCVLCIFV